MPGLQACSAGDFPPLRQVHGGIAGHGHLGGALSFTRSGLSRKGRREHGEQRAGCGPAPSSGRWGPGRGAESGFGVENLCEDSRPTCLRARCQD